MEEPIRCQTLGVGITIEEGEVDVVLTTGTLEQPVYVLMTPEMSAQIASTLMFMVVEARILQDRMAEMSPDEVEQYLTEIQRRNVRGFN